jgi:hypothetical protein
MVIGAPPTQQEQVGHVRVPGRLTMM